MSAWWAESDSEKRAKLKAADEVAHRAKASRLAAAPWVFHRGLENGVSLYRRGNKQFAFRGGSRLYHTWRKGDDVGRRLAFVLAQTDLPGLPPRMRAIPAETVEYLRLRRSNRTSIVMIDRGHSLLSAINDIRRMEAQQ